MADGEGTTKADISQAIGKAIVKQAEELADHGDSRAAAAALKDLAEAMAWLSNPNQPH